MAIRTAPAHGHIKFLYSRKYHQCATISKLYPSNCSPFVGYKIQRDAAQYARRIQPKGYHVPTIFTGTTSTATLDS